MAGGMGGLMNSDGQMYGARLVREPLSYVLGRFDDHGENQFARARNTNQFHAKGFCVQTVFSS